MGNNFQRKGKGLTFVEMVFVLVIIGIVLVLGIFAYMRGMNSVKRDKCFAFIDQIEAAIGKYAADYDLPDGKEVSLEELVNADILKQVPACMTCPGGGTYEGLTVGGTVICTRHGNRANPKTP